MSRKMKSGYEKKDRARDAGEGGEGGGTVEGAGKRAPLDNGIGEKF